MLYQWPLCGKFAFSVGENRPKHVSSSALLDERIGGYALVEKAATGSMAATTCPISRFYVQVK
jgi:hypothetical protein